MSEETQQPNQREKSFLFSWSIALGILFVGITIYGVSNVKQLRDDAANRHAARLDPNGVEPGKTAAETNRPATAKPKLVKTGIYLEGISSISIPDAKWGATFYIWFRWTDPDINPGESFRIVEGKIDSKEKIAEKTIGNEKYALYSVTAEITKFFNTSRYPLDDHLITLAIEDAALTWEELEFVPDTENSGISSRVKMPGYKATKSALVTKPHTYKSQFGDPNAAVGSRKTYSQLLYGVVCVRNGFGPYWKVFLGLFAAIFIALLPLFIKPTECDPRFGLGVGGFFGAVANALLVADVVTDNGVLTLLDIINGTGIALIFLSLVQSTISLYIYDTLDRPHFSKLFDRVSFIIFTLAFLVINISVPLFAMGH